MSSEAKSNPNPVGSYQIRLEGHIDRRWEDFGDISVAHEADGTTCLTGPLIDQAALYGLLKKIRDTGIPLVSVTRVEADQKVTYI